LTLIASCVLTAISTRKHRKAKTSLILTTDAISAAIIGTVKLLTDITIAGAGNLKNILSDDLSRAIAIVSIALDDQSDSIIGFAESLITSSGIDSNRVGFIASGVRTSLFIGRSDAKVLLV